MFDIIGDVHGHLEILEKLLDTLGYYKSGGSYRHRNRKAIFLGDYIDRGPRSREVVQLIADMVDTKDAIALPGNHEFNFLCYNKMTESGNFLRPHDSYNNRLFNETLKTYEKHYRQMEEHLDWFQTLPMYFENEDFRVIHAAWIKEDLQFLSEFYPSMLLSDTLIYPASNPTTREFEVIKHLLKGVEYKLPNGVRIKDNNGMERGEVRIQWWEKPKNKTLKDMAVRTISSDVEIPFINDGNIYSYSAEEKILFFGHYCLPTEPLFFKKNICCLDYCIYREKRLAAYRWDGEKRLDMKNLVVINH